MHEIPLGQYPISTVIFDLDGTLSDTAVFCMGAIKNIAPKYGLPIPEIENIRDAMGYADPEFFYRLYPETPKRIFDIVGPLISEKEDEDIRLCKEKVLFDGCMELLESLKEKGIRLCIASTGSENHVNTILSETGIEKFFGPVISGRADKTEAVRGIVKDSDVRGFVIVGDMVKDHVAARENGIISVGACYGYCKRGPDGFDYYIDHPLALLDILHFEAKEDN